MKKRPLLADALIGLGLTLFVLGSYLVQASFLESLELKVFDLRSTLRGDLDAGGREIAIVSIDDDSIARLGRWPWPRTRYAEMIDLLAKASPKVIGWDIFLSEPERNQGLAEIQALEASYQDLVQRKKIIEKGVKFAPEFSAAAVRLDTDARLLASLEEAKKVVLPMFFATGGTIGAKPEPLPEIISNSLLTIDMSAGVGMEQALLEGTQATVPLTAFAEKAMGVGHINVYPDLDGVVRRESPVIKYGDGLYPSYALQLVIAYLGFKPSEVKVAPGQFIELGKTRIPIDETQSMLVSFNGPYQTFRYYPFHEVLGGKVALDVFKDKIVIVGPSASGISTLFVTPVAHNLPSVELIANVVENILHQKFLVRPPWALNAELGLVLAMGLFLMILLPRLKAAGGAIVTLLLAAALLGTGTMLFVQGQWLKVVYPTFLLAMGYLILMTKRFVFTEKGKELVEASAIETNKMLGLSFQGQGMLDLAFDKFRLCPLDDQLKDLLYNLGLDFERKRQYNKAVSVYEHVASKDPKYKDIPDKIKTLKAAAEGAVFGGIGGGQKEGTVLISGGASKPTLGRYEIEKELGRGAMGIVYLGKDPKINRKVAIKTMMLEEGSDPAAFKEVKERFFREAESAGTLNHPNIVRIFDAGEEQDISYIAMELLDGQDLIPFTRKESLLKPEVAMEYVAVVADALDYAHAQGIVHRDIKPGNIMLLKDGTIRVADFGIARITASSKTATGTVMGTPSYMSPEQVAGKKVDGRSDLFSLGVALFELLTGEKPFKGGEGIGTLLFQIANDPEPEPLDLNPNLPRCVSPIIHKALAKDPEKRYLRGSQLAADLRRCLASLGGSAGAPAQAKESTAPIPVPAPQPQAAPAADATIPAGALSAPISAPAPAPSPAPSPAAIPVISAPAPVVTSDKTIPATTPLDATLPAGSMPAQDKTQPGATRGPRPSP